MCGTIRKSCTRYVLVVIIIRFIFCFTIIIVLRRVVNSMRMAVMFSRSNIFWKRIFVAMVHHVMVYILIHVASPTDLAAKSTAATELMFRFLKSNHRFYYYDYYFHAATNAFHFLSYNTSPTAIRRAHNTMYTRVYKYTWCVSFTWNASNNAIGTQLAREIRSAIASLACVGGRCCSDLAQSIPSKTTILFKFPDLETLKSPYSILLTLFWVHVCVITCSTSIYYIQSM